MADPIPVFIVPTPGGGGEGGSGCLPIGVIVLLIAFAPVMIHDFSRQDRQPAEVATQQAVPSESVPAEPAVISDAGVKPDIQSIAAEPERELIAPSLSPEQDANAMKATQFTALYRQLEDWETRRRIQLGSASAADFDRRQANWFAAVETRCGDDIDCRTAEVGQQLDLIKRAVWEGGADTGADAPSTGLSAADATQTQHGG